MIPLRNFLQGLCFVSLLHLEFALDSGSPELVDVPDAGIATIHPLSCDRSVGGTCRSSESGDQQVEEELVASLETDDHVTVVEGSIELGELVCDSLDDVPESTLLRFAISSTETVIAERTSFSIVAGDVFTDNAERKVWIGDVVDPAPPSGSAPATISMTWTVPCEVETFLLKMVSGSRHVKSVPCAAGSANDLCMVELNVDFSDEEESEEVFVEGSDASEEDYEASQESEEEHEEGGTRFLAVSGYPPLGLRHRGRRARSLAHTLSCVHPSTALAACIPRASRSFPKKIDVMVLYSPEAMSSLGGLNTQQMETNIAKELVETSQAMQNSDIPLEINLVHVAQLPYTQESSVSSALSSLASNRDVAALRDAHFADLVQLIGDFSSGPCGQGYIFNGYFNSGFSVVEASCLDNLTHTHEIGHNLGAGHNREDASTRETDYAHGYRHCSSTDRYRTVMSLATGCNVPRVNLFSNPDVDYLDKATGTSTENNAREIRENMVTVANYRVDDSCASTGDSCSSSPDCCTGVCTDEGTCAETCSNGLEGIDGNGVVCCPLECGQCGGGGCVSSGKAYGLGSDSCCGGGVKARDEYCDETGEAPCIIGSRPKSAQTCSNGLEGIDGNGVVCCPLECGQCGGSGCVTSGKDSGLGSDSCCGGGVKARDEYCDETGEAPCIIGSRPESAGTCSNGLEGIDGNGVVCCPLECGQCGGDGCSVSGKEYGLGSDSCCGGAIKASGRHCDDTKSAPCII
ncbi:unnamed protein product [Scytosiphon promiscuus]